MKRKSEMPKADRGGSAEGVGLAPQNAASLDTLDSLVGGKRRCHTAHRHADMKRDGWKCCVNCGMDFYAANAGSHRQEEG